MKVRASVKVRCEKCKVIGGAQYFYLESPFKVGVFVSQFDHGKRHDHIDHAFAGSDN